MKKQDAFTLIELLVVIAVIALQKLDDNGDMFYIPNGKSINLTQWRNGGTNGDFPEAVRECFRHAGLSNTCWLDGHVSGIKETTGEDVPAYWYTGVHTAR